MNYVNIGRCHSMESQCFTYFSYIVFDMRCVILCLPNSLGIMGSNSDQQKGRLLKKNCHTLHRSTFFNESNEKERERKNLCTGCIFSLRAHLVFALLSMIRFVTQWPLILNGKWIEFHAPTSYRLLEKIIQVNEFWYFFFHLLSILVKFEQKKRNPYNHSKGKNFAAIFIVSVCVFRLKQFAFEGFYAA